MKKQLIELFTIWLALTLCINVKAIGQQPDFLFEQQYPYEWEYAATHSLEVYNESGETDCYMVAACNLFLIGYTIGQKGEGERALVQQAKVLKLSPEGELLGEMAIGGQETTSTIIKLYCDPTDSKYCLAFGRIMDTTMSYNNLFLAKFDLSLNLSWLKEIELPEGYRDLFGGRSIMDSSGDIVFCSWPFHGNSEWSNMLYVRLSPEGELLAMGESPFSSSLYNMAQGGLFEFKDGSGDFGQTVVGEPEGYGNPPTFLVRMNRDFTVFDSSNLVRTIRLTETDGIVIADYYSEAFSASLPDGYKFIGSRGIRYDGYNPELWDEVIVAMKLDQNDSIVALSFIPHDNDSVRTLAFCQGLDESSEGSFFLCNGVYDPLAWYGGEIGGLNRFVVTKTDADANIIWRRYYGDGEHVFQPCSVVSTSDGGCLVTGRCWATDLEKAQVFVIKFFRDGSLSVPEIASFIRPYMFYPNPTQTELHLQYSPDIQPKQIELYDLQGRLVRSQSKGLESLNMAGLPAGTYTMRVMLEDGKVFSDKVVKE